ncbi:uncharacterized protein isoform X2 [Rhodnius prolixus]
MEPLIKYSQRDPLYDKHTSNTSKLLDHQAEGTSNLVGYSHQHYSDRYDPYQYYSEPEPIIEIIIKESNESLPTTPRPTLAPTTTTKEPVQVFYIKYKKNPHKEDDVIYEPPVPALTPHVSEIIENESPSRIVSEEEEDRDLEDYSSASPAPPSTTTLRTIIRPDSEIYHGSALKITFGPEVKENSADRREETESSESSETTKGHYFKRQPPPYHSQAQPSPQFIPSNGKRPQNSQPVQLQSTQQVYRFGNLPTQNYHRPLQFGEKPAAPSFSENSRLQQPYATIPKAQSSYQTPTPAQIQQYQQHKLYLHQQNLRHQALREQQQPVLREHQQSALREQQQPALREQLQPALREQQPALRELQQPVLREQQQPALREHQQPVLREHQQPAHQPIIQATQPSATTQKSYRAQLNIQPSIPVHYSRQPPQPLPLKERKQQFLYNQISLTSTTERPREFNTQPRFGAQLRQPQQNAIPRKPTPNFAQPSQSQYFNIGNYQKQNTVGQQYHQHQSNLQTNPAQHAVPVNYKQPSDSEIVKSISKLEEHQVESSHDNKQPSQLNVQSTYQTLYQSNEQVFSSSTTRPVTYRPLLYSTTTKHPTNPTKTYTVLRSTTQQPQEIAYQPTVQTDKPQTNEENEKKKANLAALPDEVPDDLREQLLSSGILGNADIQILDYDKVGDVPIESLPPEALENLYAAGSAPVPALASPPNKESEVTGEQTANERESKVEMKIVRFDPTTQEGQSLAETYVQEDATHLDPVVLNDSRYNRYLPLKIDGSQFPIPDSGELHGRVVHSVVVLAPVDYDLLSGEPDRDGRASRVQGVRFLAGTALKTVVRDPSKQNYEAWLEREKATPTDRQSVVLLVTRQNFKQQENENVKNEKTIGKQEIFMYDLALGKISKLKGELSSAFVQVAESNSGSDELDGLPDETASESLK